MLRLQERLLGFCAVWKHNRKGIDGEKDRTVYVYSERTMTQEEYARLQAELESPATKMIMQSMSSIEMNVAMMQEMMEV